LQEIEDFVGKSF